MAEFREESLHGRWVHSHEEDTEDEMVFRPAGRSFPPSRGRTAFDLRPDGTYVERSPGPVDRPEEASGAWSLEDGTLRLGGVGDHSGSAWRVAAVEDDRLTLRK